MKRVYIVFLGLFYAGGAMAGDSWRLAEQLSYVLVGGEVCGFNYDKAAIQAYIDQNVESSDLKFAPSLSKYLQLAKHSLDAKSDDAKVALCRQVGNTARNYGFMK